MLKFRMYQELHYSKGEIIMKTSMKKVLSLALAGALALTSVFSVNAVDASNAKKAAAVKTATLLQQ